MNRRALPCLLGSTVIGIVVAIMLSTPKTTNQTQALLAENLQLEKTAMTETQIKLLEPLPQSEAEWKKILTPEQFRILRKKGTERAFTGAYWNSEKHGIYRCAGCGQTLFSSDHKFDSGTGWPSFWQPLDESHVALHADNSLFARRTEVVCSRCDGHLGHVFNDGPRPTGLRYCMNSAALKLDEQE